MNRVVAGIYDPDRSRGSEHRETLTSALSKSEPAHVEEHGPLTLAFDGPKRVGGTAAGTAGCLLDGHIYNIAEVAGSLGLPAEDPEAVLARGFTTLGDSLLTRLRGDFALVSWDERGDGLLACDQLGGRALVFQRRGRRLLFASEIRYLLRMLPARPEPDPAFLAHWLGLSSPPGDRTIFGGVWRIRPAHLMRFGPEPARPREYWRPRYRETVQISRAHAAAELRTSLERAIERRCGPPHRTGVLLSGGLDSSSVAGLAARSVPKDRAPRAAYSAVFPGHRSVDEAQLIDRLTGALDLPSVRIAVHDGSVLAGAVEYISTWQVPPTSPNLFFWLPLLRRAAADGVDIMLDGQGGDEMFSMSGYLIADRLRSGRLVSALSLARQFPSGLDAQDARRVRARIRDYGVRRVLKAPVAVRKMRDAWRSPQGTSPDWFGAELAQARVDTDEQRSWLDAEQPEWAAWLAHSVTGNATVLAYDYIRQRSKLAGLEARHPLIDVDVIELMLRLPPEFSFDSALNRPLLREAVAGLVPDELRLRTTKSSFDEVFRAALTGPDMPVARRLLEDPRAELARYIDLELMSRELLAAPPTDEHARIDWAVQVWRLLTAECWLRSQADPSFTAALLDGGELRGASYELLPPF